MFCAPAIQKYKGSKTALGAVDTGAPSIASVTVAADGLITFIFSEDINIFAFDGWNGLSLSLSGGAVTIEIADNPNAQTAVFGASRPITSTEIGTASFTQPGDGIQDLAGNLMANIAGVPVTNNSTFRDTIAPTIFNVTVEEIGDVVTVVLSEAIVLGVGDGIGFEMTMSGGEVLVGVTDAASNIVLLATGGPIHFGETGTLTFTQPGDGIQDLAGNLLATVAGVLVTNNSEHVTTLDDMLSLDPATPVGTRVFVNATGLTYELQAPSTVMVGVAVVGAGYLFGEFNGINFLFTFRGEGAPGKGPYRKIGEDGSGTPAIDWDATEGLERWYMIDETGARIYESTEDVLTPDLVEVWTPVGDGINPPPTVTPITQGELDAGLSFLGAGDPTRYKRNETPSGGHVYYDQLSGAFLVAAGDASWVADTYLSSDLTAFPWEADWSANIPVPTVTRNDVASLANWLPV